MRTRFSPMMPGAPVMPEAGAQSMPPTLKSRPDNRHEAIFTNCLTQHFNRRFGCRRYFGDRRQDFDRVRPEAVAELHARGIIFAVISSRATRGLRMLVDPLQLTTPICGFNGGVIARPDLSVITEHLLALEIARRAVDLLDAHNIQVWILLDRTGWCAIPAAFISSARSAQWDSGPRS